MRPQRARLRKEVRLELTELVERITNVLVDKQAENIVVLDISTLTTVADYFIIASGTSGRHLDALQYAVTEALKQEEPPLLGRVEGTPDSGWVLIDLHDVVVHLFAPEVRAFYRLEELWKSSRLVTRLM